MIRSLPLRQGTLALIAIMATATANAQSASGSSTTTGSVGCAALVQASTDAVNARIQSNDAYEAQPSSVSGLSCLGNFFNGTGLNLVSNFLNPSSLIQQAIGQVEGQICNAAQSEWQKTVGSASQCGLSLNGVNMGLNIPTSGGLMCPSLSFGGSGPQIGSLGATVGGGTNMYVNGSQKLPLGYIMNTSNSDEGLF